jgi:hypothetical protein
MRNPVRTPRPVKTAPRKAGASPEPLAGQPSGLTVETRRVWGPVDVEVRLTFRPLFGDGWT